MKDVNRELRLVDCTSIGLRSIGVSRSELIESDRRAYPETALWTRALHEDPGGFDGLTWVSRQHDTSRAVVLFGGRMHPADLTLAGGHPLIPLAFGVGREILDDVCDRADIAIIDP